ncbi:probable serine hydrolase [Neocloeon triangulifer]|uniref:probable serine hydrolase n=1 Tax=Neocloeon triangulifer TaxID=2078957 RepID=UPI00286EE418|nr:probable serine hydrolase [Neocloeon triangulifer]
MSRRLTSMAARRFHTDFEARQSLRLKPQPQPHQEVRVEVPWGQVAVKVWGEPGPVPLVALHDWRDNAASFDQLAPLLNMPLVAIDLPGHGRSSAMPPAAQTFSPSNIFTLRYVLRKLGYKQVSLMGHGNGAHVGLLYAGLYPDAVGRLILLNAGQSVPSMDMSGRLGALVDSILEQKTISHFTASSLDQLVSTYQQRGLSEEASRVLLQRSARKVDGGYIDATAPWLETSAFHNLFQSTETAVASKVKCPVLSVEGQQQGVSEISKQVLAKAATSFQQQIVNGSHYSHLEQPEEFATAINEFMA